MKISEKKRLSLVVLVPILTALVVSCSEIPPAIDVVVELAPERIARGKYLVEGIAACASCHTPGRFEGNNFIQDKEKHLAGGFMLEQEGLGIINVPNITPDVETGIGAWTDGEIIRAIREGVGKDGKVLFPMMPYIVLKDMSDNDVKAIVAYLRSIPPVKNEVEASRYAFPLNILWPFMASANPAVGNVPDPPSTDPVAQGKYLVSVGHCSECHTPRNGDSPEPDMTKFLVGGMPFNGPWGTSYSANLTPDKETGLTETDDEIVEMLREGTTYPPMSYFAPYHKRTSEEDLRAVIAYLRSLPPIINEVPEPILPENEGE